MRRPRRCKCPCSPLKSAITFVPTGLGAVCCMLVRCSRRIATTTRSTFCMTMEISNRTFPASASTRYICSHARLWSCMARVPRVCCAQVSIELTDAFHAFSVGDVVKADLKGHGSWYTGRIIAIDTKFRVFTIKYENGHLEKHVPPSRVQVRLSGGAGDAEGVLRCKIASSEASRG